MQAMITRRHQPAQHIESEELGKDTNLVGRSRTALAYAHVQSSTTSSSQGRP